MTKRLGRGLADLIETTAQNAPSLVMLKTQHIRANRFQPRTRIHPEALEELKQSIKQRGVIQPVIVRPLAHGTYELVAGERRWRAAQALGIEEVPAVIRALSDRETVEHSLVENLQREDLNPIEEAKAYVRLAEEFGYTQETVAETVGKDRTTVANALRLLRLPEEIQQALSHGTITMGHAKALLAVEGSAKQLEVFRRAVREQFSVRQLEAIAASRQPARRRQSTKIDPAEKALEDAMRRHLGTKVRLVSRQKGGRIVIEYFSSEDLERIVQALGVAPS